MTILNTDVIAIISALVGLMSVTIIGMVKVRQLSGERKQNT